MILKGKKKIQGRLTKTHELAGTFCIFKPLNYQIKNIKTKLFITDLWLKI